MDRVSSRLMVEKAGQHYSSGSSQPESAASSPACISGNGGYACGSKRSSELTRAASTTGSCGVSGPDASSREAAADNSSLIGNAGSAASMSNDSSGGNNGHSNKSQAASYSKIFLQYLPHTLNLNYMNGKRAEKRGSQQSTESDRGSSSNFRREQVGCDEIEKQLVSDTSYRSTKSSLTTKSIVSAFSRFKVSSQQQQRQQPKKKSNRSNKQQASESQEEGKLYCDSDLRSSGSNQKDNRGEIITTPNRRAGQLTQQSIDFGQDSVGHHKINDLSPAKEVCSKIKRKGFLYLKKKSSSLIGCQEDTSYTSACSPTATFISSSSSGASREVEQRGSSCRTASKKRDLNNNSITNLLAASCHQHEDDEEHNQCLLGDDNDDDDDDDLQEAKQAQTSSARQVRSSSKQTDAIKMINSRHITADADANSAKKQQQQQDNYLHGKQTRSARKWTTRAAASGGDQKTNMILASISLVLLLGSCLIIACAKLALAQSPQSQQPFSSRSQPSGNQLLSAGGGGAPGHLSPGASGGPGNAGNRPAPQPAAGSLVANINCNKIKGHVTLTPNLQGGTTVGTQISAGPPGEVYQWSVHQFPVKPGAAMCSCSPMILGTKLIDLSEMHGNLPSDQEFNVQSSLNLFGSDSPVGHSLLLRGMKTGMVACATFLPTSRKSNYRAKFHTPISGSATIFQTAFGTSFIAHLMYSNGTRRHSMHRFDLVKSEDDMVTTSLLSGVQVGGSLSAGSSRAESLLLEQREHEHELGQCRRYATGEPLFRNTSYQLAVSTENFGMRGRTALVLPQIPFETFASVFVVVYSEADPDEPIACAPLKFVKPKTAAAKFQSVSVQGSVVFSQDSPYDVTVARVSLSLPNSDGHSYGIDELPMIIRRKSDTRVCPNIREIIYNPHHVEPSSVPAEGEATSDQYAVGDLSGKYGSLTGKASEKITANDYNLPLYGPISVVGRAMTVYSAEGVAIACSNVELTTPMTTAFATFDYGIQGQFIFRQPVNDCNGDTYVYIEVSKPVLAGAGAAADQARSLDHNWHIHANAVDSGLDHLSTTDCAPAGPHFNPYNTSTGSIYSRDCTPFNVLRCELGDLAAKMFTIEIPPYRVKGGQEPDIGKFFGTDIDLPLCGPVSIVNRSVVVHAQDFGHHRLACSTVIEFKPRAS